MCCVYLKTLDTAYIESERCLLSSLSRFSVTEDTSANSGRSRDQVHFLFNAHISLRIVIITVVLIKMKFFVTTPQVKATKRRGVVRRKT
jgi:hypothetical protein